MRLRKHDKVLKPVHPNSGIEAEYRRKLNDLIEEMQASYDHWLVATYRANRPAIAQDAAAPARVTAVESQVGHVKQGRIWFAFVDGVMLRGRNGVGRSFRSQETAEAAGMRAAGASAVLTEAIPFGERFDPEALSRVPLATTPAQNLEETLQVLGARWEAKFEEAAPKLARWFASSAARRSDAGLKKILRDGGMTVDFQMTPVMRDIFNATVSENVGLIKSIASQYHTQVQGMVMRSVAAGRDLGSLTGELEERFGITRRRAAGIALDQNNKQTSNMVKVRQAELGLEAIWLHSAGGREPRPTHVANSGKPYDPKKGWLDPAIGRYIWPGTEINCRCVSRSVVRGFS